MFNENIIKQIKDYAEYNNVPIMEDDSIEYLKDYIKKNNVKKVLEIGAAIGYSAIMMCSVDPELTVVSIERDEKRYLEAIKNIKRLNLQDRIDLLYQDALEVNLDSKFDLVFIDAAKAQSRKFFEKFEKNLNPRGTIITDNMHFHGLVDEDEENIESRNLRQLVRKIKDYITFLQENRRYETEFVDVGDGLAVSKHIYE